MDPSHSMDPSLHNQLGPPPAAHLSRVAQVQCGRQARARRTQGTHAHDHRGGLRQNAADVTRRPVKSWGLGVVISVVDIMVTSVVEQWL